MFTVKTSQKNKKQTRSLEGLEALREFPNAFSQTVKQEGKNLLTDAFRQITSLERDVKKFSGELKAGESVDLKSVKAQNTYEPPAYPETRPYRQPNIDYHREFTALREVRVVREDTRQIQVRIEQILFELKSLTRSSQELSIQFAEVSMEQTPEKPGEYHISFFEWVFSAIRRARERIDESQTWLALFKSKRTQRSYWNMFKKHGTTFGLSGERVVATQTG